jgi:hypothetical protein
MAMQRAGKPVNVGNHIPYIICLAPAQQQAALTAKHEQDTAAMDVVDGAIVDVKTDGTAAVKHDGEGTYALMVCTVVHFTVTSMLTLQRQHKYQCTTCERLHY